MTAVCRRAAIIVLAASASLVGCQHRVGSDQFATWELRGAIVEVSPDCLRVRHKSGQVIDLLLDDGTLVVRGVQPLAHSALTPGTRVRVDVEPLAGGAARARTVRVYSRS